MTNEEIVNALRGMAMDVFRTCEGCDLEENCSVRGCAVLMEAADAMENLQTENAALRRVVDNILNEQAMMIKEFTAKLEELAEVKAERDAAYQRWAANRRKPARHADFGARADGDNIRLVTVREMTTRTALMIFCSMHCPKKEA